MSNNLNKLSFNELKNRYFKMCNNRPSLKSQNINKTNIIIRRIILESCKTSERTRQMNMVRRVNAFVFSSNDISLVGNNSGFINNEISFVQNIFIVSI